VRVIQTRRIADNPRMSGPSASVSVAPDIESPTVDERPGSNIEAAPIGRPQPPRGNTGPASPPNSPKIRSSAGVHTTLVARDGRLVMHRAAADTGEYWDAMWKADPPRHAPNERLTRWYREPAERHLPKVGLIVEAGCGNGNIMRTFTRAGWRVEGLDFAERTIDENRRIDPAGLYRVGDVRELPYGDGSLAGYISLGVIEHFADDVRAGILRECSRCLRPGGAAFITTPYYSPLRSLRADMGLLDRDDAGLPFYQYYFTRSDLARQIEDAGLTVVEADAYDIYKGIKDTIPAAWVRRTMDRFKAIGPRCSRFLHHPPRWIRDRCGHMQLIIARKP
jgi:SAM-dependent methyltransferase